MFDVRRVDSYLRCSRTPSPLRRTNRWLLHVARAFVMNPEVLIVHKPTALVDDHHGQLIMEMMREFVDQVSSIASLPHAAAPGVLISHLSLSHISHVSHIAHVSHISHVSHRS